MRDIKIKQKIQAIKTKDTKGNIQHFIKQQTIHNKNVDRKEDASVKSNAQVQATNNVSITAKQTVIEYKYRESNHDIHPQRISYICKAKKHVVNKVNASKVKQTSERIVSTLTVQNTTKAVKTEYNVIKKSVSSVGTHTFSDCVKRTNVKDPPPPKQEPYFLVLVKNMSV